MQSGLPPGLTDAEKAEILSHIGSETDRVILASLLQGLYTGVIAVALWNIYQHKSRPIGPPMIIVIVLLYIITLASFSLDWLIVRTALIDHGMNIWTTFMNFESPLRWITIATGIFGAVCTVLVDATMIWRCWQVWGRRWQIVLLPTLCLVAAIVLKIIVTCHQYADLNRYFHYLVISASLTLATTLWCTLLVIYRVLAVARVMDGVGAYLHVLEVLVESSALYAVSLVLYVALFARGNNTLYYVDPIAGITRGIAPTLLVGRVAAGHARAEESWNGSVMTSPLRFGQDKTAKSSLQDSTATGYGYDEDVEARPGSRGGEQEDSEGSSDKTENQSEEAIVELRR